MRFKNGIWICFGITFLLFTVGSILSSNTIFLKSYSQQRNSNIASNEFPNQVPSTSTGKNPYLLITLQVTKNPINHGSTGIQYEPKDKSIMISINDSGNQKTGRFVLVNSTRNQVIVSNVSIFPTLSFSMSVNKKSSIENIGEISRVFFVDNVTKQVDGQLYQGISRFIPITVDNKVYPQPVASFYQYQNGTGILKILDNNPPIHAH
jgi:hypothetical protein